MSVGVRLKVAAEILKETFVAPRHASVIHIEGRDVSTKRVSRDVEQAPPVSHA